MILVVKVAETETKNKEAFIIISRRIRKGLILQRKSFIDGSLMRNSRVLMC